MLISLLLAMQCSKLPSEEKGVLGNYAANLKVLMASSMQRSGFERITIKKRVKRALSSFKGAIPLVVLFFVVCQANFHDLKCAFFLGPRLFLLEQSVPKYA